MTDLPSSIFRVPVFKRIDDPWIGLFVLAGFTLISAIIAMVVLCLLWRRHQQRTKYYRKSSMLSNAPSGQRAIPLPVGDPAGSHYDSQRTDLFASPYDRERNLDEFHRQFSSHDAYQPFYERATKAYF